MNWYICLGMLAVQSMLLHTADSIGVLISTITPMPAAIRRLTEQEALELGRSKGWKSGISWGSSQGRHNSRAQQNACPNFIDDRIRVELSTQAIDMMELVEHIRVNREARVSLIAGYRVGFADGWGIAHQVSYAQAPTADASARSS